MKKARLEIEYAETKSKIELMSLRTMARKTINA